MRKAIGPRGTQMYTTASLIRLRIIIMPSSITEIPGAASGHNAPPYMETANEPTEIPGLCTRFNIITMRQMRSFISLTNFLSIHHLTGNC